LRTRDIRLAPEADTGGNPLALKKEPGCDPQWFGVYAQESWRSINAS